MSPRRAAPNGLGYPFDVKPILGHVLAGGALVLCVLTPNAALADEPRSDGASPPAIVVTRAPATLDVTARAPLLDPRPEGALSPRAAWMSEPQDVRLNEDQWLVVGAAAVLGVVLLVVVVSAVVD